MVVIRVALLIALIATSHVSNATSDEAKPRFRYDGKINSFIHGGLPFFATRVDPSNLRQLSGFEREVIANEKNPYDEEQTDTSHVLSYVGMTVWIWCAPKGSTKCITEQVSLTKRARKIRYGLNIGASASFLKKVLGKPDSIEGDTWIYGGRPTSAVSFVVERSRIKEILWVMYTG
jgi:hypothetical protein